MISLAGRDILHAWGKNVITGMGLGLLIGVTLIMAGVYRGMVDDGKALLDNSGADLVCGGQGYAGSLWDYWSSAETTMCIALVLLLIPACGARGKCHLPDQRRRA